jgi:hypothetical protein
LPPACAECVTTLLSAVPGSLPSKLAYTMARASDGRMRIDYGTSSVITNPATGQTILLDHLKLEVRTIALPQAALPQVAPPPLQVPGIPAVPGAPAGPAMSVIELGVRLIEGQEVVGRQYTMPPAPAPGMPAPPGPPTLVSEVWMHAKLLLPVLTRITGSFGQQMCHCKTTATGEPPASTFQIPANYQHVGLPPAPAPPSAPAMPKLP